MKRISLKVPRRLAVWFDSSVPSDTSRNKHLTNLIRRAGRWPEQQVCPNDMTLDGEETVTLRLDEKTADILVAASAQMCLTQAEYLKHLMRHAGLTVTVALDAETLDRLTERSGGDVENYIRTLIKRDV